MARVLQLVTELVVGGATLSMLDFAENMADEHEIVIAHGRLDDPANAAARRARGRFATYELPRLARPLVPREDIAAARAFAALCRRLRPDLIHTHSSKAGFIGRVGAGVTSAPLLHTIHGWGHTPLDSPQRRRLLINAERLAARRTTKLIAVSPEVRDEGLALRIGNPDRYAVIGEPVDMAPRAADFNAARAAARAQLKLPPDADVVGWVGRFSPQKDPQVLAEALTRLLDERHNAYAVLIGDGPDRELVAQRLREEIRARRVFMAGERPDVRQLYPAFDVLLHTTLWEGHPRVVREALAERVPVVTGRVSGTSVLATDARLGVQVKPGDVDAYVWAMEMILGPGGLRAPVAESALAPLRAVADEPYRSMRELYDSALAQTRGERG